MNPRPQESPARKLKTKKLSDLEQQKKHASIHPEYRSRGLMAKIFRYGKQMVQIGALGGILFGVQTAVESATEQSPIARAQDRTPSLTEEQRAELFRLFTEGNTAFNEHEYERALALFRQAEAINTVSGVSIDTDLASILSWNICQIYLFQAEFRLFSSDPRHETPAAATRRRTEINDGNRARLEEVMGFSTLAQLQPVRDSLLEAQRRLQTIQETYEHQLDEIPEGRSTRRTDLEGGLDDTRRAIAFVDSALQRIQPRYAELERSLASITTVETAPITETGPLPTEIVAPIEVENHTPSLSVALDPEPRTERPWALGLAVGGGGLALIAGSAIVNFAVTPGTFDEGQTLSVGSNVVFWTGITALSAGVLIIALGEYQIDDTTVTATIAPQPGGAVIGMSGQL